MSLSVCSCKRSSLDMDVLFCKAWYNVHGYLRHERVESGCQPALVGRNGSARTLFSFFLGFFSFSLLFYHSLLLLTTKLQLQQPATTSTTFDLFAAYKDSLHFKARTTYLLTGIETLRRSSGTQAIPTTEGTVTFFDDHFTYISHMAELFFLFCRRRI